ncbi:MAG: type II toxin-antitoxin system VapC family toxin [Anaerolineales bacterium]|nr:type II toxin-antitoxin system VapC family toxin [Anaerolineales bacterium]
MLTIYLDASALLKRYLNEAGAKETRQLIERADEIATTTITRVEIASALARLAFSRSITDAEERKAWAEFEEDWEVITRLPVASRSLDKAVEHARQYRLRGYDAVHLGGATLWQGELNLPVLLATFDRHLWSAGKKAGLDVWPEGFVP